MKIYFSGLSGCKLIHGTQTVEYGTIKAVDKFIPIPIENLNEIEIGWDYILIWMNDGELYLSGKINMKNFNQIHQLLQIPDQKHLKFIQAIAGPESVTVLTENRELWIYHIYNETWTKVLNFIIFGNAEPLEYVVKILQGRCTVALTNFGHVYTIPSIVDTEKPVKFIDAACGYDHTILLSESGEVYSMGMGTRGQLGHCDLEDCDEPKLIEALAGLKVKQISAGGWHSAVITNEGDLYTWGWNNEGQLGIPEQENVVAIPTVVDFKSKNSDNTNIEINLKKVQCGSAFTIVLTENHELWGSGSNKYGQLGRCRKTYQNFREFILLNIEFCDDKIKDIKCREWSSCIYV